MQEFVHGWDPVDRPQIGVGWGGAGPIRARADQVKGLQEVGGDRLGAPIRPVGCRSMS